MLKKVMAFSLAILLIFTAEGLTKKPELLPKQQLGKKLFFDEKLSRPPGQSCAACHAPQAGYNGIGNAKIIIYEGAVDQCYGNRNAPSAAYASFSPIFHQDENGEYVGGQFWDGRAATLADQAKGPFLNPVEQNLADKTAVIKVVRNTSYAGLFGQIYGKDALNDVTRAYDLIADAIAAFEQSAEVNRFSSKYDAYLAGKTKLSDDEMSGLKLFEGKAKCVNCHPSRTSAAATPPLFTDFKYDNIGVPKNPYFSRILFSTYRL